MADLAGMDALIVIASNGFRDEEYHEPAAALAHEKAGVVVAASSLGESTGMLGYKVKPDLLLADADVSNYEAVIFVGGQGAAEYFDDPAAHKLARDAAAQGKLVCAICIAPAILANAGLLRGRKATCWSSQRRLLESQGAKFVKDGVVRDGNLITADGPESAHPFARAICEALMERVKPEAPQMLVDEE